MEIRKVARWDKHKWSTAINPKQNRKIHNNTSLIKHTIPRYAFRACQKFVWGKKNVFDFLAPARGVTQAKYYPDNSPIYEWFMVENTSLKLGVSFHLIQ